MIHLSSVDFISAISLPPTFKMDVWLQLTQAKIMVPCETEMISFYDAKGYKANHYMRVNDYYTNFLLSFKEKSAPNLPFVRIRRRGLDNYIFCVMCHIINSTDLKLYEGFHVNGSCVDGHIPYGINLESALCLYL